MAPSFVRRAWAASWRRRETSWAFALAAAGAFALVEVVGHAFHEVWRDELHCWAVGRNASGLLDVVFGERRYDGHPFLWYYLLHLASRVARSYRMLHVVGAGLAIASALLWLRYAPVPRLLRVLFLLSYYFVYEYGIVTRSYSLGIFLVFVFCVLYHPLRVRYLTLAFVLGLLAATSLYGTWLAVGLGFFLFSSGVELRRPNGEDRRWRFVIPARLPLGLLILIAALALTAATTLPPDDSNLAPGPLRPVTLDVVKDQLFHYWTAMFPTGWFGRWSWYGSDALFTRREDLRPYLPWFGLGWFLLWLAALARRPRLALGYALGALLMAAGQHAIYPAALRHLGNYFVLSVACAWLFARDSRGRAPTRLLNGVLAASLVVQGVTGVVAFTTGIRTVFSRNVEAAAAIRAHHLEDAPIVADGEVEPAVATILDRPFFLPATKENADFVVWHNRRYPTGPQVLVHEARRLALEAHGRAAIVSSYDLGEITLPGVVVERIFAGGPCTLPDESHRVYQVQVDAGH